MSITIQTDVFCDWCSNWVFGAVGKRPLKQLARKSAAASGFGYIWSIERQKYEDVCPSCLKKLKTEEARNDS